MTSTKYVGMDVCKESISIAVRNSAGNVVMDGFSCPGYAARDGATELSKENCRDRTDPMEERSRVKTLLTRIGLLMEGAEESFVAVAD
jgi:hypothetical protein